MNHSDSRRLKRLSTLTKQLDATIDQANQVKLSCTDNLHEARRAGVAERRKVQTNDPRRKKVR